MEAPRSMFRGIDMRSPSHFLSLLSSILDPGSRFDSRFDVSVPIVGPHALVRTLVGFEVWAVSS